MGSLPRDAGVGTSCLARVSDWLDRHFSLALVVELTLIAATVVARATRTAFWHDEIYTLLSAEFPLGQLRSALLDGFDLSPPLNTVLTHGVYLLWGQGLLLTRLPAMLSAAMAALLVAVMVRRRSNAITGLSAPLLLCLMPAYRYVYEARGYGLTVGLFSLALYSWSEAAAGRHRRRYLWILTAAFALGIWAHYYAVLAVVPVAVGELVRQWRQKRIDRAMWMTFPLALVLTLPLYPLMAVAATRAANFWTHVYLTGVPETYAFILGGLVGERFLVLGVAITVVTAVSRLRSTRAVRPTRQVASHEVAAGLAGLALPALGIWVVGAAVHGVFADRYVLLTTAAVAVVVPLTVWRLGGASRSAETVMLIGLLGLFGSTVKHTVWPGSDVFIDPFASRPTLVRAVATNLPVVVTGGIDFLPIWNYAPVEARSRVIYLVSPGAELRETGTNTIDLNYAALARHSNVSVRTMETFLPEHGGFWLYDKGSNWIVPELRRLGATLREDVRDNDATLYRVDVPPQATGN